MMSSYATAADVARYLSLSRRTIYKWVREGKIPGRLIGKKYRFELEEIDRWLEVRRIVLENKEAGE